MIDSDINTVEPFVESVPQLMTIVALATASGRCIGPVRDNADVFWWVSSATSALSATLATARFLKVEFSRNKKKTMFFLNTAAA